MNLILLSFALLTIRAQGDEDADTNYKARLAAQCAKLRNEPNLIDKLTRESGMDRSTVLRYHTRILDRALEPQDYWVGYLIDAVEGCDAGERPDCTLLAASILWDGVARPLQFPAHVLNDHSNSYLAPHVVAVRRHLDVHCLVAQMCLHTDGFAQFNVATMVRAILEALGENPPHPAMRAVYVAKIRALRILLRRRALTQAFDTGMSLLHPAYQHYTLSIDSLVASNESSLIISMCWFLRHRLNLPQEYMPTCACPELDAFGNEPLTYEVDVSKVLDFLQGSFATGFSTTQLSVAMQLLVVFAMLDELFGRIKPFEWGHLHTVNALFLSGSDILETLRNFDYPLGPALFAPQRNDLYDIADMFSHGESFEIDIAGAKLQLRLYTVDDDPHYPDSKLVRDVQLGDSVHIYYSRSQPSLARLAKSLKRLLHRRHSYASMSTLLEQLSVAKRMAGV